MAVNQYVLVQTRGGKIEYVDLATLTANTQDQIADLKSLLGPLTGWFLPSKDQIELMYLNLHYRGVGGFANALYWSSTESGNLSAGTQNFGSGIWNGELGKSQEFHVRACRSFTSDTKYKVRDIGPSGGWIFLVYNTNSYLECAPSDQSTAQSWSNIINASVTGTSATDGQTNTTLITGQSGHTSSAAKLCNDLTIGGNEVTLTQEQIEAIAALIPATDISGKADKVTGYSLVPDAEITKLAGITGTGGLTQSQILTRQL